MCVPESYDYRNMSVSWFKTFSFVLTRTKDAIFVMTNFHINDKIFLVISINLNKYKELIKAHSFDLNFDRLTRIISKPSETFLFLNQNNGVIKVLEEINYFKKLKSTKNNSLVGNLYLIWLRNNVLNPFAKSL